MESQRESSSASVVHPPTTNPGGLSRETLLRIPSVTRDVDGSPSADPVFWRPSSYSYQELEEQTRLAVLAELEEQTRLAVLAADSADSADAANAANAVTITVSDSVNQTNRRQKKKLPACSPRPYMQCYDLERQRAWIESIHKRVWQSHTAKAYDICELMKKAGVEQKKKNADHDFVDAEFHFKHEYQPASEVFDSDDRSRPWKPKTKAKREKKVLTNKSIAARKLGLTKAEEFTGTEEGALKNLLRNLRTKTWDPELYFHIRFFSIRNKLHALSPEAKALARQRWHFLFRMLRTMCKIDRVLTERSFEKSQDCLTCIDMVQSAIQPVLRGPDNSLVFDKDDFKPPRMHFMSCLLDNQQLLPMLSIDAMKTLRDTLPEERTPEEVDQAILSLQYVDDFAKLPTGIQRRIVEEAYYLSVQNNRVVLRQGHLPQNYYFVLLGQAISKRFLSNKKTEVTAIIRKGKGFGSVAIYNGCPRLVTVVSQTFLHLLVVPKDVFIEQFMDYVLHPRSEAINFLSKMWFMHFWPMKYLKKCPQECHIKQFRRSEIIEASASKSEWIYVVRKGSCRVYQKVFETRDTRDLDSRRLMSLGHSLRASLAMPSLMPSASPSGYTLTEEPSRISVFSYRSWLRGTKQSRFKGRKWTYKWVQSLRELDVFGLEDLDLDPKNPPPHRNLMLLSDDVECVMLSKQFYLRMAGPELRKKIYAQVTERNRTMTQVTNYDCSMIRRGGVTKHPDVMADPMQPIFCIHC